MDFEFNDLKRILFLVLFIPLTLSTNIDCQGKSFHCVNSTHFMICVDLGVGALTTIDDFIIACPATTVCDKDNLFECEFPQIQDNSPLNVIGVDQASTDNKHDGLLMDGVSTTVSVLDTSVSSISDIHADLDKNTSTLTKEYTDENIFKSTAISDTGEIISTTTDVNITIDMNTTVAKNDLLNLAVEASVIDEQGIIDTATSVDELLATDSNNSIDILNIVNISNNSKDIDALNTTEQLTKNKSIEQVQSIDVFTQSNNLINDNAQDKKMTTSYLHLYTDENSLYKPVDDKLLSNQTDFDIASDMNFGAISTTDNIPRISTIYDDREIDLVAQNASATNNSYIVVNIYNDTNVTEDLTVYTAKVSATAYEHINILNNQSYSTARTLEITEVSEETQTASPNTLQIKDCNKTEKNVIAELKRLNNSSTSLEKHEGSIPSTVSTESFTGHVAESSVLQPFQKNDFIDVVALRDTGQNERQNTTININDPLWTTVSVINKDTDQQTVVLEMSNDNILFHKDNVSVLDDGDIYKNIVDNNNKLNTSIRNRQELNNNVSHFNDTRELEYLTSNVEPTINNTQINTSMEDSKKETMDVVTFSNTVISNKHTTAASLRTNLEKYNLNSTSTDWNAIIIDDVTTPIPNKEHIGKSSSLKIINVVTLSDNSEAISTSLPSGKDEITSEYTIIPNTSGVIYSNIELSTIPTANSKQYKSNDVKPVPTNVEMESSTAQLMPKNKSFTYQDIEHTTSKPDVTITTSSINTNNDVETTTEIQSYITSTVRINATFIELDQNYHPTAKEKSIIESTVEHSKINLNEPLNLHINGVETDRNDVLNIGTENTPIISTITKINATEEKHITISNTTESSITKMVGLKSMIFPNLSTITSVTKKVGAVKATNSSNTNEIEKQAIVISTSPTEMQSDISPLNEHIALKATARQDIKTNITFNSSIDTDTEIQTDMKHVTSVQQSGISNTNIEAPSQRQTINTEELFVTSISPTTVRPYRTESGIEVSQSFLKVIESPRTESTLFTTVEQIGTKESDVDYVNKAVKSSTTPYNATQEYSSRSSKSVTDLVTEPASVVEIININEYNTTKEPIFGSALLKNHGQYKIVTDKILQNTSQNMAFASDLHGNVNNNAIMSSGITNYTGIRIPLNIAGNAGRGIQDDESDKEKRESVVSYNEMVSKIDSVSKHMSIDRGNINTSVTASVNSNIAGQKMISYGASNDSIKSRKTNTENVGNKYLDSSASSNTNRNIVNVHNKTNHNGNKTLINATNTEIIKTYSNASKRQDIFIDKLNHNFTSKSPINQTITKSTLLSSNKKDFEAVINKNSGDKANNSTFNFDCRIKKHGKYVNNKDCQTFYVCAGKTEPVVGICPNNTVFSETKKQCTRNLSHCVTNNQFHCLKEGRFSDMFEDNIYYICVKNHLHGFLRYKLQCQTGYFLNKNTVKCEEILENRKIMDVEILSQYTSSASENIKMTIESNDSVKSEEKSLECKNQGNFEYSKDLKKYYVCSRNSKGEYRRKIKRCSSDEIFDKEKKECVSCDSDEC